MYCMCKFHWRNDDKIKINIIKNNSYHEITKTWGKMQEL